MEETPRISASRSPKKWSKFFFWKYLVELRGKSGYITCVKVLRGGMGVEGGKLELAFHRPLGSEIIMGSAGGNHSWGSWLGAAVCLLLGSEGIGEAYTPPQWRWALGALNPASKSWAPFVKTYLLHDTGAYNSFPNSCILMLYLRHRIRWYAKKDEGKDLSIACGYSMRV